MGWFYLIMGLGIVLSDLIFVLLAEDKSFGIFGWIILVIGIISIVLGIKELLSPRKV
jgi:hypothetical protein